ncbi:hypothetical protein ANOM_008700 [Aspergillus nomiae NRRL 13137]|uniref:Zn(2)-C6 fungal-type domain-containing protein n=1 Tax=Aspergillus nomiae NRRL (strain ATCC 15546 / NRRL 13137 / CBS 260.88 / M93) TaxID=1509407 RepID=A0A0L1IS27_ASPN3|nr:uncharacterized protein ANOM_008700 [Aspergillus nomiae NRRL 13137]KNG82297.1 hypothetical protein ANOM_008700 [Aspergillus nomiae NRRL 13137]
MTTADNAQSQRLFTMKNTPRGMVRKNGKPISCEPCRISKIRCDHQQPTCRRCDVRGLSSKCYYHPAPLTRPRKKAQAPRSVSPVNPSRADDEALDTFTSPDDSIVSTGPQIGLTSTSQLTYLGSTSFMSAFHRDQRDMSLSTPKTAHASTLRKAWSADFTHVFPRLVQLLRPLKLYEDLITDKYHRSPFTVIPAPLVLTPLRLLRNHWDREGWPHEGLGSHITQNTATNVIKVEANMTTHQFYRLFTGVNLRWEFVGLIFALAGLGASISCPSPLFSLNGKDEISQMPLPWRWQLQVMHVLKSAGNHHIYAQFGDLVSCIHAMGLHRPHPPDSSVPFFLSQTRKRVFTASYRTDKNLATFLGRPPRLSYHYCDVELPLDLDDHSLILDHLSLDKAVRQLTSDGWGAFSGGLRPATVIRLRYMIARLREQVMELSLGRGFVGSRESELQMTYQECKRLWDRVPKELHYSKRSWGVLGPHLSIISLVIHLEYLYTVFQVERIRCSESPDAMTDLLDSAMQIVSAVTDFTKQSDQEGSIREKYTWIFLFYALPAAGVVATELHRCTVSMVPLPCSMPRSRIIRDLNLLASWFESANPPTSYTHQACVEVTKAIIKLLDDTLDYPSGGQRVDGPQPGTGNRPGPNSGDQVRDNSHSIGGSFNTHGQSETIPNVDTLETSEDFLNWLDELGLDTSVPEFFGWQ